STLSRPGAPQSATATAGDASIRVGWAAPSADGGAPVMSYRLRWKFPVASFAAEDVAVVGASVRAHTITGLRNGEVYDVQIAAGNSEGLGEPAELQATPGGRPNAPSAPTLAAADSAPGTLTVTWSPVSGPVTGYRVRWGKDATSVSWNGSGNGVLAGDESARSYVITGLESGAAYQVQVAAVNAVGTGAWSPSATATSLGAPGAPAAPTAAVGSAAGSLDITWAAPSSNGGSAITGYRVRWGQDAASVAWNASGDGVLAGDQNTLSYAITGLETGTAYQVQVAAVNARGTGAWSPSATATPQAARDDASITALRVGGADGVTVVTLSPAFSAATTSYAASVATGVTGVLFTADFVGSKLVVAGDANNAPDSGAASSVVALTVGASRDITLVVTAQDGSTTKTYTVTITRAAGAPAKPARPTVARATTVSRSINISWTWAGGAANNGSDLTEFHVQWKKTGATNWLPNATGQVISDTSARAYAVTGLDAGARYHARVRAVNGIGNGAWSDNSAANRASGPPAKPISIGLTAIAGGINVNVPQFSEDDGGSPRLGGTQVRWRVSSGPGAWQPDANGRYQTGNNIRGLNCEVQYDVQGAFVNGFAADNVGAWSDIRKATPTCVTLTLNPAAATKVYGASDPALDYQLGGGSFSGGDTKASVFSSAPIERVAGENAGEYDYRLKNPIPWGSNNNPQGKYRVAPTLGGSNKFTITAKEVTYTSTAADKTYDGNTNAPADLGGSFTAGVVTATVNGVAIDDTATGKLSVSGGQFQNKNAGDNKAVTQFALGGDAKDNYTLAAASSVTGDIAKLATTLTLNVNSRVYDATTNTGAVTTVFSPEILSGDTVTVDTSGAAYADADAGTG
ncbi:MAG: fibronectin type III domain-containing protein, partial [Gammaproteobacteria bacterium]|nr:fibronectin type III domain-containing protein [Gammaproteobacteria bacterium]